MCANGQSGVVAFILTCGTIRTGSGCTDSCNVLAQVAFVSGITVTPTSGLVGCACILANSLASVCAIDFVGLVAVTDYTVYGYRCIARIPPIACSSTVTLSANLVNLLTAVLTRIVLARGTPFDRVGAIAGAIAGSTRSLSASARGTRFAEFVFVVTAFDTVATALADDTRYILCS